MRLPTLKVYRAFRELDPLPDESCERYVRRVRANATSAAEIAPSLTGAALTGLWIVGWPFAIFYLAADQYVPMPDDPLLRIGLMVLTVPIVAGLGSLLTRDAILYFGLRRELRRTNCRKCGQSMLGVPITTIGDAPDPAKTFIRCPECGRKYCLLDLGLSRHDLAPIESVAPDIATIKRGPTG